MKRTLYVAIFLFSISVCRAQVPAEIVKTYRHIVKLIREDNANELATMIQYPLKRKNPLPDIANAKQFIANYSMLFDEAFKQKLKLYNDSDIFQHDGSYGLVGGAFNGDMWMNESGKIAGIAYNTAKQIELMNQTTKKIQSQIYPGINTWKENIIVCKSAKLLIRIDWTDKGLRYVCWTKGRPTSEKPDLILYNGIAEAQGTMGGWTWTFKNGDWTYEVDDVEMCETDDQCGYFLRLLFKDVEKSSVRLKEIK
jgi:hypothetical protein